MLDIFIATDTGDMTFIEFLDMVSTFSPKVRGSSHTRPASPLAASEAVMTVFACRIPLTSFLIPFTVQSHHV